MHAEKIIYKYIKYEKLLYDRLDIQKEREREHT